jgi:tRNA1(Val) A37 N6-methylase TrmN6
LTVELHEGDCRDWLPLVPDASVDAVICDPPGHFTHIALDPNRVGGTARYKTVPEFIADLRKPPV